jgi:hypothetical protein
MTRTEHMIFLIEYSNITGTVVSLKTYEDCQREEAENARLERELSLNRDRIDHELVSLEANDVAALLKTHRRYFQDARGIVGSAPRVPGSIRPGQPVVTLCQTGDGAGRAWRCAEVFCDLPCHQESDSKEG